MLPNGIKFKHVFTLKNKHGQQTPTKFKKKSREYLLQFLSLTKKRFLSDYKQSYLKKKKTFPKKIKIITLKLDTKISKKKKTG